MSLSNLVELPGVARLREANKAQAAEFFDTSIKTIDGWIRKGCPVVKRGSRSEPWVLDLFAMAEWYFTEYRSGALGADGQKDPEDMTPQDRKAHYEAETKRRDLQARDRELIPATEAERVIAVAFAAISQDLRAIPDNLERRVGLSGDIASQVESEIFNAMDSLADKLAVLGVAEE